ncbi:hypothetical protein KKF91_04485 [Myxococcota bacterium]|nr:hypothetical protein [Myxococcota bacterium]
MPLRLLTVISAAMSLLGCGGYASTSEAFRVSLNGGRPQQALASVNEALGVDTPAQRPSEIEEDTPLLLLERATILQALGEYELSKRDFQAADAKLDVLDLVNDTAGNISKYLFSDDATLYKSPPHEKLLLNTLNLINYLVTGDLSGAKVEARRFTINRKFLDDVEGGQGMLTLGSYLAGFAFEMSGAPKEAMLHYAEAHEAGGVFSLAEAAQRLSTRTGITDKRLAEVLSGAPPLPEDDARRGEVLIIVQAGMAPYLVPERMPVGAAVIATSDTRHRHARLSPAQQQRSQRIAAKGLVKWISYPLLRRASPPPAAAQISLNGVALPSGVGLDIEDKVIAQYESVKGALIASALVRMIARAVAGEISQAAAKSSRKDNGVALLVGLLVEGAMVAADTPDTRGWVTLPARVILARARLPEGRHRVEILYRGRRRSQEINLKAGGWAVVNFSNER